MEAFKLLFMCVGFVTTVDIFVKVQFEGSAVVTSYRHEETITARNELELREKLTKTLQNALLDKQIDEVTITADVYHDNKFYSTQVTKFDATTLNGLDETTLVTTAKGNDITEAKFEATTANELDDTTFVTTANGNDITKAKFDATTANELDDTTLVSTTNRNGITEAKFDATTPNGLDKTTLATTTKGNDITEAKFDATTLNGMNETTLVTTANGNDITKAKFDATTPDGLDDTTIATTTKGIDITEGKFDATTPNGLDGPTSVTTTKSDDITKAITSSATSSIKEVHDVTTTTVLENVFTTRSITSIASTQSLKKSTSTVNTEKCDVTYKSKCFRVVRSTAVVSAGNAEFLCKNKLANIYDFTHLNLLKKYLRPMIPAGLSWIGVCTGMTYKDGKLYATNGQAVSLSSEAWHQSYPSSDKSRLNVGVGVNITPESQRQGLFNALSSRQYFGALCEYGL
uniref:uncharacterized protein LOC120340076 n=1 Tax=Styela clava TaxID=7725 RepID=UPI00193ABF31|nr:uncharacterized protein LOC120340076 [Styela clava]